MASTDGINTYAERALLTNLLGASAKTRILAVMLKESHRDLSANEIAELADVHRSTVYDPLNELEDLGVIKKTRTVGGSSMYQLNKDSAVAARLKQVEDALIDLIEEGEEETAQDPA
jgi:Fe2+ or Zn2+ uptake regulation protein